MLLYAQSLLNSKKRVTFSDFVTRSGFDILLVTETWLNSEVSNAELLPSTFPFYRAERLIGKHGDVLIGVKDKIAHTELSNKNLPESFSTSLVLFEVGAGKSKNTFLFKLKYNPPDNSPYLIPIDYMLILLDFQQTFQNHHLIVAGDFNLPKTDWLTSDSINSYENTFASIIVKCQFKQLVSFAKAKTGTLDLLFTNNEVCIIKVKKDINLRQNFSNHYPIKFEVPCVLPSYVRVKSIYYNYCRCDYDGLKESSKL